jgi:DNA-binding winged helix-turn-helix (wHTH) protein/tetratricopeptide (TPR) repeat protein
VTDRFEFSDFVIDGDARELRRAGCVVEIEPKAFELLLLLASRPEHAFSKQEIADELWPGRVISDSVIAQCVRKARDATGDSVAAQAVIKTVHGTGYRFSAGAAQPTTAMPRVLVRYYPVLLAITVLAALVAVYWLPQTDFEPRTQLIVAVLPVEAAADLQENLAEGLESLLVRTIAEQSSVRVISSSQTLRMLEAMELDPDDDDDEILLTALRGSLGADYLLRPRLTGTDGDYQASAVLFSDQGYAEEIAPPSGDIVAMVMGFSRALAAELGVDWQELKAGSLLSADNFVNEAFARGLRAALQGEYASAISLFESVLHLEPELVGARYELGFAHWLQGETDLAREQFEIALEMARKKDMTRQAGHAASMLGVLAWQRGDLEQAERFYRQSLEDYAQAGDDHAAGASLGNLGNLADTRGDLELAAELHLQARQRFRAAHDQVSESFTYTNMAILSRLRGRLHEAQREQAHAVEMQRRLGVSYALVRSLTNLASIEYELGRIQAAVELLEEAKALAQATENRQGLADIELEKSRQSLYRLQPQLAATHAEAARAGFSALQVAASEIEAMALLAESALLAGDHDAAFGWLDQAEQADTDISKPRDRATRMLLRARLELAAGHSYEAEAAIRELMSSPDPIIGTRARAVIGELHWENGRAEQAVEVWRRALGELESVDEPMLRARLRTRLARALIDLGQLDEAHRLLITVGEWNHDDTAAAIQRARLLLARDEADQAWELLDPLLNSALETPRDPDLESLRMALAECTSSPDSDSTGCGRKRQ